MFKLFIVDDNKYERNGIRSSIDWEKLGIEVVGVFSNGSEALENIDELKPDIIITDIAMPVMNGIVMSGHIRDRYPNIKIIFISCHSDFVFAKSAIDMGVYGYVLKPFVTHELEQAVNKLVTEFNIQEMQQKEKEKMKKQMEEMLPMVQEQFFKELLLGNFKSTEDILESISFLKIPIEQHNKVYVISIKPNYTNENIQGPSIEDAYFTSYSIKSLILSFDNDARRIFAVQISAGEYSAILFNKEEPSKEDILNTTVDINNEISKILNINTTMGISKCTGELFEIARLYKQSNKAINTGFYSGSNPIILFEEIEDSTDNYFEDNINLEMIYQEVKTLISFGTDEDIKGFINKYLDLEGFKPDKNYVKSFCFLVVNTTGIILMESNLTFKDIFGDDIVIWKKLSKFETIMDIKQWLFNIFNTIREHLADRNSSRNVNIVNIIKDIIKNKYNEQITIEEISKSVYLSGRQANSIFKKETGKTIFDYIIEFRIEMAKKLLKNYDSKVASVAEMVGYENTSYFCLAFKKNVGMTPAEYKSKVIFGG